MEPFLGQLMLVPYNFAPRFWALCQGQLLAINQNQALFSLLGTTYGGDGRTTFGLPELRGRVPISSGQSPGLPNYTLGSRGGQYQTTLNVTNLPSHNHGLLVSSANASQNAATNGTAIGAPGVQSGRTFTPSNGFNTASPDITLNTASISNNGGGQSFNTMPPYTTLNWVIALVGIFPSRN